MTMSPLWRAGTSRTSIVPTVLRMPCRLRRAGPHRRVVQVVPQVSVGVGIAVVAGDRVVARAAAEAADRSNYLQ